MAALTPGARLGPYEIESAIGSGGMGEVYRARDTRLDRLVAIKVLPAQVAADPGRRQRFEREAKAISRLNHPHICALYDVGQQDASTGSTPSTSSGQAGSPQAGSGQTVDFLVLEYLEGQTLADRLQQGPLPLDQALEYATQVADALDAAHRHRVVHRDLKPSNIMLTKSGTKLLDFGIAKALGPPQGPARDRKSVV